MSRLISLVRRVPALAFAAGLAAFAAWPGQAVAEPPLRSAGALAFGPGNVLFVGDDRMGAVHAFQLRSADFTPQDGVSLGRHQTFEGRDLIVNINQVMAAMLGTAPDQIAINDLAVHRPTRQIFLSVSRGRGPDAQPAIFKVDDGKLELLDLDDLPHTMARIGDLPDGQTLEFGQRERSLAITDIDYYDGELFVAGVSNEEFASTLRRIRYPFDGHVSMSSIEIWHAVHGQFETRAPILQQVIRKIDGKPYLIGVYACTPLVRIALEDLKDGAHVRGQMIGELGFGNTPLDMIAYKDPFDHADYVLVTNSTRSATRIAVSDIGTAKPLPVNVPKIFHTAGVDQVTMPLTGAPQLDLIDDQWAVVVRRNPNDGDRLDLHTLPVPFFFDRADHIVEMNWPGAPDPFGYRTIGNKS